MLSVAILPTITFFVDDKLRLLSAIKQRWASRVTTVFPRQGHYANAPSVKEYPLADITIEHIGDLRAHLQSFR
jgi:hypothetical protein